MSSYIYNFNLKTDLSEIEPLKVRSIHLQCTQDEFYETFEYALQFKELNDLNIYIQNREEKSDNFNLILPETISNFCTLNKFSLYADNKINVTLPKILFELESISDISVDRVNVTLPNSLDKITSIGYLSLSEVVNLPSFFEYFPNLTSLVLGSSYTSNINLPSSIGNCTKLINLDLSYFNNKTLPFDISKLASLQRLHINYFTNLTALPESIFNLSNINTFFLKNTAVSELPEGIGKGLTFNSIYLKSNPIKELPASFYTMSCNSIHLENNQFEALDFRLFNISNLRYLNIEEKVTEINNVDPKWVKENQNLEISFEGTAFDVIPPALQLLPVIKSLNIKNSKKLDCTGISKIKKIETLHLSNIKEESKAEIMSIKNCKRFVGFRGTRTVHSDASKFYAILFGSNVTLTLKEKIIKVIQKKEALDHFSIYELLCSITVSNKEWQLKVEKVLQKRISEQLEVPLNKDSNLFILGKISTTKTEFKEKYAPYFNISNRLNDKVTHFVLGRMPKEVLKLEEEQIDKKFISESDLTDYVNNINPGYIIEEASNDSQISDNIKNLLLSEDESSQLLALEMLKTGGIPKDIINELFFIQKTTNNSTIRKATANVLKANAPNEMLVAVNDRSGLRNPEKFEEYELYAKFKKLSKKWNTEVACQLAYHIYQKHKIGLRYIVVFGKKTTLWEKVIPFFLKDGVLDWTSALGYEKRTDVPNYHESFFNAHRPLPNEILKNHKVTELILHNSRQEKIEDTISEYVDLEILDISYNDLNSLPYSISELSKLKVLDLKYNFSIKVLPKGVYDIPSLEQLHISEHVEFNEEIFKKKLPNCQVIKYESKVKIEY
ncbi:leucine-rich repeat domain-containing protein [Flammeovirga aprica]|uniref:Leucine-rich repeat domain-containing protein n=1 Tax=Flammeovirga aprica JL-4 TaxID=694437 RepID=A0A7X9P1Y1_9BACT|nr:leucine-rich repeat domain-containing protein [Flammeovirga aprica]NME68048.1 hypothetical protein [Flammeovirga aprica JL-4]